VDSGNGDTLTHNSPEKAALRLNAGDLGGA
jgi:hypothetical protein